MKYLFSAVVVSMLLISCGDQKPTKSSEEPKEEPKEEPGKVDSAEVQEDVSLTPLIPNADWDVCTVNELVDFPKAPPAYAFDYKFTSIIQLPPNVDLDYVDKPDSPDGIQWQLHVYTKVGSNPASQQVSFERLIKNGELEENTRTPDGWVTHPDDQGDPGTLNPAAQIEIFVHKPDRSERKRKTYFLKDSRGPKQNCW